MKATLKDLFLAENSYIIEIPINDEYYLFVEGLDENGCTNTYRDEFSIEHIKTFCVELMDDENVLDNIDSIDVTLDTTIEELKQKATDVLAE